MVCHTVRIFNICRCSHAFSIKLIGKAVEEYNKVRSEMNTKVGKKNATTKKQTEIL